MPLSCGGCVEVTLTSWSDWDEKAAARWPAVDVGTVRCFEISGKPDKHRQYSRAGFCDNRSSWPCVTLAEAYNINGVVNVMGRGIKRTDNTEQTFDMECRTTAGTEREVWVKLCRFASQLCSDRQRLDVIDAIVTSCGPANVDFRLVQPYMYGDGRRPHSSARLNWNNCLLHLQATHLADWQAADADDDDVVHLLV